jgi:hypothetical protein
MTKQTIEIKKMSGEYRVAIVNVNGLEVVTYRKTFVTFTKPTFAEIRGDFKNNGGSWDRTY